MLGRVSQSYSQNGSNSDSNTVYSKNPFLSNKTADLAARLVEKIRTFSDAPDSKERIKALITNTVTQKAGSTKKDKTYDSVLREVSSIIEASTLSSTFKGYAREVLNPNIRARQDSPLHTRAGFGGGDVGVRPVLEEPLDSKISAEEVISPSKAISERRKIPVIQINLTLLEDSSDSERNPSPTQRASSPIQVVGERGPKLEVPKESLIQTKEPEIVATELKKQNQPPKTLQRSATAQHINPRKGVGVSQQGKTLKQTQSAGDLDRHRRLQEPVLNRKAGLPQTPIKKQGKAPTDTRGVSSRVVSSKTVPKAPEKKVSQSQTRTLNRSETAPAEMKRDKQIKSILKSASSDQIVQEPSIPSKSLRRGVTFQGIPEEVSIQEVAIKVAIPQRVQPPSRESVILGMIGQLQEPTTIAKATRNQQLVASLFSTPMPPEGPAVDQVREVLTTIDTQLQTLEAAKGAPYEALFNSKIEFLKIIDVLWDHKLGQDNIPLVDLGIIPTVRIREKVAPDSSDPNRLKPTMSVQGRKVVMQKIKLLGEGSQGLVKSVRYADTGEELVAKKFDAQTWSDYYDAYKEFKVGKEIARSVPSGESLRVMAPLDIGFYGDGKDRNIVIFYPKALRDMRDQLSHPQFRLNFKDKIGHFLDAAKGLSQMHRAGYAHNDFKTENALVISGVSKGPLTTLVTDLGLAVKTAYDPGLQGMDHLRAGATLPSKEAIRARRTGSTEGIDFKKVDVFAFVSELAPVLNLPEYNFSRDSDRTPLSPTDFEGIHQHFAEKADEWVSDMRRAIGEKVGLNSTPSAQKELLNFMLRCIADNPQRRPSMDEVVTALLTYRRTL